MSLHGNCSRWQCLHASDRNNLPDGAGGAAGSGCDDPSAEGRVFYLCPSRGRADTHRVILASPGAHLTLGEEAGYRLTVNGKVPGADTPIAANLGKRLAWMFLNMGTGMRSMQLHGHPFQAVDVGMGALVRRDVVAVPSGGMGTVKVDLDNPGSWYLHCNHLYQMATGMMTQLRVTRDQPI